MKEDQSLFDAGIKHARAVVVATNDDVANLEVALDARRISPHIRVCMRLFDQQLAGKITGAFGIDHAFSASALAAPMVAGMSFGAAILSTAVVAGTPHVVAEVTIEPGSPLAGKKVSEIESQHAARILAMKTGAPSMQTRCPPTADDSPAGGSVLTIHVAAERLAAVAAAARASRS
jgi:voltage-gated potassium channel